MHKNIYQIVTKNIKKYRKLNHVSQKELAYKSGYSYSYIKKIENEKNHKSLSLQTIYNISETLGIDIKCFFEDSDI